MDYKMVLFKKPDMKDYHACKDADGNKTCPPIQMGKGCYGDCYDCFAMHERWYDNIKESTVVKCTCAKIAKRMECLKCGYPFSEADVVDDGSDCGCENPKCSEVMCKCGNHNHYCTCKE